ncbi:hypothetical protein [Helicobacter pylori]|uniref:hypothetical protein n=1 Tax=Helicobacter pylori TaxID=210 RepID=UPI003CC8E0B9
MSLCLVTSISHALVIQTMQDWNLRKNSEFKAFVVVGNKVQENTLAMGHYKVSENRANLSISVTHIKKGNDYKTLQSPPNAIKEIKGKLVLKKGTRIVLGGENDSEMSNAIGVSKSTYTSSKNGKGFSASGTSGTSTNGIAGSDGSSGANGSNGANGTSTNGIAGSDGSSGANGSNDNLPQYTTFEIQEMSLNSSQWTATSHCNDLWGSWTKTYSYTGYSQGNLRTLAKWVTQYKTINQGTTIEYIRPRNEGDSDVVYDTYKYYYVSQAQKTLKRIPLTIYINSLNLSDEYRKNFELTTLSQELNLNNGVKQLINTQDFTNWQATYYRPNGNGNLCMSYSFSSGRVWKPSDKGKYCSWAQTPNANYSCASHNNWIVPNK